MFCIYLFHEQSYRTSHLKKKKTHKMRKGHKHTSPIYCLLCIFRLQILLSLKVNSILKLMYANQKLWNCKMLYNMGLKLIYLDDKTRMCIFINEIFWVELWCVFILKSLFLSSVCVFVSHKKKKKRIIVSHCLRECVVCSITCFTIP